MCTRQFYNHYLIHHKIIHCEIIHQIYGQQSLQTDGQRRINETRFALYYCGFG